MSGSSTGFRLVPRCAPSRASRRRTPAPDVATSAGRPAAAAAAARARPLRTWPLELDGPLELDWPLELDAGAGRTAGAGCCGGCPPGRGFYGRPGLLGNRALGSRSRRAGLVRAGVMAAGVGAGRALMAVGHVRCRCLGLLRIGYGTGLLRRVRLDSIGSTRAGRDDITGHSRSSHRAKPPLYLDGLNTRSHACNSRGGFTSRAGRPARWRGPAVRVADDRGSGSVATRCRYLTNGTSRKAGPLRSAG